MSVRTMASREQIAESEAAYRLFREKQAGSMRIQFGQVRKGGQLSMNLMDLSIGTKTIFAISMFLVLLITVGGTGLYGMGKINANSQTIYENRVASLDQVSNIAGLLDRNRILIMDELLNPSTENINSKNAELEKNINTVTSLWDAYLVTLIAPEEKVLADNFSNLRAEYVKTALMTTQQLIVAGKLKEARASYMDKVITLNAKVRDIASKLAKTQSSITREAYLQSNDHFKMIFVSDSLLLFAGALMTLLAGFSLTRSIRTPIIQVTRVLEQASQGMRLNTINISRNDELGKMLQMLESWATRLGFETTDKKRHADETLRIKIALDNVSTGVMIANHAREIVYANKSVIRILKEAESEICKALPNFSADNLVGVNIDSFHKNPKHQADLLASLTKSHAAQLVIGNCHMQLIASPVINESNERLGAVVEWQNRTAEVRVQEDVAGIVQGALIGNFDNRISMEGKEGFFGILAEGLNSLGEITSKGLNDVAQVLQEVAHGNLTKKIDADYAGIFGHLKDDTNATVERLCEIIGRIQEVSSVIDSAAKQISAGNTDLSSRTEEQACSLEEIATTMEELNTTVKQNADNAKQANQLAHASNDIAVKSGQMVQQIISTMSGISESSKKITDIIGVIDSIAFQTNILALNAAVEAARAGEQGRGFAVVATEVRNLSHRSATAAKEIKDLIVNSGNKVEAGTKLVDQAGQSMAEVVSRFQQVTTLVTDIANASQEQAIGIEQVTRAISQMDNTTQQNAAMVEESAAAAGSLEERAQDLIRVVSMFKLAENEGDNSPGLPTAKSVI